MYSFMARRDVKTGEVSEHRKKMHPQIIGCFDSLAIKRLGFCRPSHLSRAARGGVFRKR